MKKRMWVLLCLAMLGVLAPVVQAEEGNALVNLFDSPVKTEAGYQVAPVVLNSATHAGAAPFGCTVDTSDDSVWVSDLFTGDIHQYDADLALLQTVAVPAMAGVTTTGLAYDAAADTLWVYIVNTGTFVEIDKAGVATGNTSFFFVGGAIGPATIDPASAAGSMWCQDIAFDAMIQFDLASSTILATHNNPDNTGGGAFGNGLAHKVSDGFTAPGDLIVASGAIVDGQVSRLSEGNPSAGRAYVESYDVAALDTFVNGVAATRRDASETVYVVGNATNTIFEIGSIRINEIRIDQPSTDNDEYVELTAPEGTSLDGLTYLVIGDGSGASGVIENVTDLTGNTVAAGSGGYFLIAEASFTLNGVTPDLVTSINFENSDNVTHLLVRGFTGADGDDLDTNDDCVLDVTPWTEIVDIIALVEEENPPSSTECHYGPPAIGPDGSFVPGHVLRCGDADGGYVIGGFTAGTDDTPRAANPGFLTLTDQPSDTFAFDGAPISLSVSVDGGSATYQWRKDSVDLVDGGNISGATTDTLTIDPASSGDDGVYDCVITNVCSDLLTDGATLTVRAVPMVMINELRIDQGGTDNDEYFELAGDPGTSLDGISYVVIGDSGSEQGIVEAVISLDGLFIPADGTFLAVEDTFTLPCADTPDLVLSGSGNGINFENSDNVTHLLVANFSANVGDDLDATDDCILDTTPWFTLFDEVALLEDPAGDCLYSPVVVGPDGSFVPAHVLRCPNALGGFRIGSFGTCASTETPGFPNPACIDSDPADLNVCEGDPATFTVAATGSGTLTYQWRLEGVDLVDDSRIGGATSDTLTIDPVYVSDAGDITCVVTDDNGSVESGAAALTVDPLFDVRVGNVDAGVGLPVPVLYINGSAGEGPERTLFIDPDSDDFEMVIQTPPSLSRAKYCVYIWFASPDKTTRETLPSSTGDIAMPTPLTGTGPQPFWIANNLKGALGANNWFPAFSPIDRAPYALIDVDAPLPRDNRTFYVQGVIQDPNAPNGIVAVTNGILVTIGPSAP